MSNIDKKGKQTANKKEINEDPCMTFPLYDISHWTTDHMTQTGLDLEKTERGEACGYCARDNTNNW